MEKEISTKVQEAQSIPYRINPKRNILKMITNKLIKIKYKDRNTKSR